MRIHKLSILAAGCLMTMMPLKEAAGNFLSDHIPHINTHTASVSEPGTEYKVAATWWLPDWQNHMSKRGSTDEPGAGATRNNGAAITVTSPPAAWDKPENTFL